MKRFLLATLFIAICTVATHIMASDRNDAANMSKATQHKEVRLEDDKFRFTDAERNDYKSYSYKQSKDKKHDKEDDDLGEYHGNKGHDKKYSDLPTGLQKKVDRGGSLPPGWQKKVSNGQVFSTDLRSYSKRSPYPSPKGTSDYILEDKIIRVMDSTNVILDVLNN